jgi:hypothetical protein
MKVQEEAANAILATGIGQVSWQFASDISHTVIIATRASAEAFVERIALRQKRALDKFWQDHVRTLGRVEKTVRIGDAHIFEGSLKSRNAARVGCLKAVVFGSFFVIVSLAAVVVGAALHIHIVPVGLMLVVLNAIGLPIMRGIYNFVERSLPPSKLLISVDGIHTGIHCLPSVEIADVHCLHGSVETSPDGRGSIVEVIRRDKSSLIIAEEGGNWSSPVGKIAAVARSYMASARVKVTAEVVAEEQVIRQQSARK